MKLKHEPTIAIMNHIIQSIHHRARHGEISRCSADNRQEESMLQKLCRFVLAATSLALVADRISAAEEQIPPALETYHGRQIATTMHYLGAPWLTRESREREEECSRLLEILRLEPGQTVCDMGCGNGFYSLPLAKRVGESGNVVAVDIQPEMLELLKERAAEEGIKNIEPVLGTVIDPKLAESSIDVVLMVDVYHEFSHPEHMLRAIRRSLKPTGRVALVEFRGEDPDVPIKPLHKMTKAQIMKEFPPNGFKLVEEFDALPWQHVMFFQRDDAPATAAKRQVKNRQGR
jgi:ubiquinone/menaquinone biosynthesis C-methylase UbiE